MSETDDLALMPIILPRAEDLVPTAHLAALRERERSRHAAAEQIWNHGSAAMACLFVAVMVAILAPLGIGSVAAVLATICVFGASISAVALGWEALERVGYLWGTRDEKRYLPPDCRARAGDEARLLETARDLDAHILGVNQAMAVMRDVGEDRPLALARTAAARRALVERHERLAQAAATIPRLPAPASAPPALPAPSR